MADHKKECFGILDQVFPMGPVGLREITPTCFECPDKTVCLKAALNTQEGVEFRSRLLERTPATGVWARLRRWSEKKSLSRQKDATRGKPK